MTLAPAPPSTAPVPDRARVSDLAVTFVRGGRPLRALRGVALDVRAGELLALVGESGSGKSVLGLSLLGLVHGEPRPDITGEVEVCGIDMVGGDPEAIRHARRRHLGAVFQDPMTSLNPSMRVGRQVEEVAGSTAEARRLLDLVGVPDAGSRMSAYPHELSGGLRQRVMIAMAVAGEPQLIVADEPTTALDVTTQAQVLTLLVTLRAEIGCSVVLITHDIGVAAQVSDRMAVLYGGRIAEVGPTPELLRRPAHPYTQGLLASQLLLTQPRDRPIHALPGEPPDPRDHPPGCPFEPRCSSATDACGVGLPALVPTTVHTGASACIVPTAVSTRPVTIVRSADADVTDDPVADPVADADADPAAPPAEAALTLSDVGKDFSVRAGGFGRRTLHALQDVTLTVGAGESLAIVGESGSGKSTLLRVAAGLLPADRGRVDRHGPVRPQMIFQDAGASLTPWLTVGELVGERLRRTTPRAERRAKVAEALQRVGLPAEVADTKAVSLSGGQRQRVAFARATIVPPAVLLCDEPTSALDVSLAGVVLNLIGTMRAELSMAVLFVTHDLAAARYVADTIAVMYLGRIVEIGPSADVVDRPKHPYTQALLDAVPKADSPPARLPGEVASPLAVPPGCPFHPRCAARLDRCERERPFLTSDDGTSTRLAACWLTKEQ